MQPFRQPSASIRHIYLYPREACMTDVSFDCGIKASIEDVKAVNVAAHTANAAVE